MVTVEDLIGEGIAYVYWVDETQDAREKGGFQPSMVFENYPGHYPMMVDGQPVIWGETLEEARTECRTQNAERGLTAERVLEIRASSMRVSQVR